MCRLLLDAPSLCIHGSSWSHSHTVCLCLHRLYPFRPNAVWTYHQPTTLLEVSQQCEFALPNTTFLIDFNSNDNCKYLFWVKSRSSQSKNVAGCYGSLVHCGKYVGFSAGNEFMSPQARKAWTGHSFILRSMILIPHIFWNGQVLCYPVTWLIADICVNSNLKTLLLSQILQEKGCIFVLQTKITFILVLSEYKVFMITVLVLQASNNAWVHERLQPSLTATLYFTPAIGFAHTKGRTNHSVSRLPRFHGEDQPIHSLEQAQGTTWTQKSAGSLAS